MKFTIAQGSRQGPRPYNQDRLAYSYHRHAIFMVLADTASILIIKVSN